MKKQVFKTTVEQKLRKVIRDELSIIEEFMSEKPSDITIQRKNTALKELDTLIRKNGIDYVITNLKSDWFFQKYVETDYPYFEKIYTKLKKIEIQKQNVEMEILRMISKL